MVNNNGFPSLDPRWYGVVPLLPVVAGTLAHPGQSCTQVVDLGDLDASLSLLPFGNSERPDSPFRFALWAAWVYGELCCGMLKMGVHFQRTVVHETNGKNP